MQLPGGTYVCRQQEGFFEELESQLQDLDPGSSLILGNLTYGIDFEARYHPPEYKGAFGKTLYRRIHPNSTDPSVDTSEEMSLIMIGEVCPSAYGMAMSAKGNYTGDSGPKPKLIDDKSTIKDVLVLRALTGAPNNSFIEDGFNNQLVTLSEIMDAQAEERSSDSTKKKWRITEWLGDSEAPFLDPNNPKTSGHVSNRQLIKITLPMKYKTPRQSTSPIKKKNLLATKGKGKDSTSLPTEGDDTLSEGEDKEDETPAYGTLGALYDPNTLPDHRGNLFNHLRARLVQNDIRDENDELIFPWDMARNLRPGTVVLVDTTLVGWHVPSGTTQFPDKLIYQIQGHRVKVLSASDEEVEVYPVRTLPLPRPDAESMSSHSTNSPRKSPSSAFATFGSPSKKARRVGPTTIDLK